MKKHNIKYLQDLMDSAASYVASLNQAIVDSILNNQLKKADDKLKNN